MDGDYGRAIERAQKIQDKLMKQGVHPARFAKWLATIPDEAQDEVIQIVTGEVPGLIGARPGPPEAKLLGEAGMTQEEIKAYKDRQ